MAEVLVLADHSGDTVKKVTYELVTLARTLGEPAVVWTGPGAADASTPRSLSDNVSTGFFLAAMIPLNDG